MTIAQIRAELAAATPGRLTDVGYQPNWVDAAAVNRLHGNAPDYLAALLDVAEAAQEVSDAYPDISADGGSPGAWERFHRAAQRQWLALARLDTLGADAGKDHE